MSEHIVFRIVSVLLLLGVLAMSFLPSESVDPFRLNIGNSVGIGHIVAYALLAGATMLSVPRQALILWRGVGIVFTISLLGLAIELLQPWLEGHQCRRLYRKRDRHCRRHCDLLRPSFCRKSQDHGQQ
jgi:hypothetical protein